jgi:hypothetical protein
MIRGILFVLACILSPWFWLLFNVVGLRITFKEYFKELIEFHKSNQPYGFFDGR